MSLFQAILLLLIAGITGGIARTLTGFSRGGCIISVIVGFIGALLGNWLARELELPEPLMITIGGNEFPFVWAIIGAVIFTALLSILTPKKK